MTTANIASMTEQPTIMPIVIAGDPVLHQPTEDVELVDGKPSAEIQQLVENMYATMDKAHGVGLAANQVLSLIHI